FVQQTERNFQMMTQRALEAESKVEKLKQEISIILEELESSKVENEKLRASQMINPGVAKHSIDLALQSLSKIIMGAGWSIKHLTSGVQSLNFVAELLKSAGKISEAEAEEK
ncbi:SDCG3 protein, partial [Alcedo cyanopectus]|nr:SDCG3 protein [Ceyx cyanopectus]